MLQRITSPGPISPISANLTVTVFGDVDESEKLYECECCVKVTFLVLVLFSFSVAGFLADVCGFALERVSE